MLTKYDNSHIRFNFCGDSFFLVFFRVSVGKGLSSAYVLNDEHAQETPVLWFANWWETLNRKWELKASGGKFKFVCVFSTMCFMVGNITCWSGLLPRACDDPGLLSECRLQWKGSKVSSSLRLWTGFTAVLHGCGGQSLALRCPTCHLKFDFVLIRPFRRHLKVQLGMAGK